MKYQISLSVSVTDIEGWTRVGHNDTKAIEVEKLSDLMPLMIRIEKLVEDFRNDSQ